MKAHILRAIYQALINTFVIWSTDKGLSVMVEGIEYTITIQEVKNES